MALGVEAAGVVASLGAGVKRWSVGDPVFTHPLPLAEQGCWAPWLVAEAAFVAPKQPGRRQRSAPAGRRCPATRVLARRSLARVHDRFAVLAEVPDAPSSAAVRTNTHRGSSPTSRGFQNSAKSRSSYLPVSRGSPGIARSKVKTASLPPALRRVVPAEVGTAPRRAPSKRRGP